MGPVATGSFHNVTVPPVLLITFNRPQLTRQVIDALRLVRPARLFVANDGPRASRPNERALCQEVRNMVANEIDWPCEVKTLYHEENLGCRRGVQSAIGWFFSEVEEGVILEDDIVPDPSFFAYQAELLERYRDNPRVMIVAGHQSLQKVRWAESYRFSRFAAIWGWGSWRRVWALYEPLAASYFEGNSADQLKQSLKKPQLVDWWDCNLRNVAEGRLDTWDVQFCYLLLKTGGLCVVPRASVVQNIGFGIDATHTVGSGQQGDGSPSRPIAFPLVHPNRIEADRWYDRNHAREHFWNRHVTLHWKVLATLKNLARILLRKTS